jgi:hypothetical protein
MNSTGNTKALHRALLGALLALLTAFAGATSASAWTDNPLTTSTPIRKVHIDELRTAIAAKDVEWGYAAPVWTADPTITAGVTVIRYVHVWWMDMYLAQITSYRAVCPALVPADPGWAMWDTAAGSVIRARDFQQLRTYMDALGPASSCCGTVCAHPGGASFCVSSYVYGTTLAGCAGDLYCWGGNVYKHACNGLGGCGILMQTCIYDWGNCTTYGTDCLCVSGACT